MRTCVYALSCLLSACSSQAAHHTARRPSLAQPSLTTVGSARTDLQWIHQIGPYAPLTALSLHVELNLAVTGAGDGSVHVWQASTGRLAWAFSAHRGPVEHVTLSEDGRWLVTANLTCAGDPVARVWDVEQRALMHELPHHADGVVDVALDSASGLAATVAGDRGPAKPARRSGCLAPPRGDVEVRLWDLKTGQARGTLSAPSPIHDVEFGPSADYVYGALKDERVAVWSPSLREPVVVLPGTSVMPLRRHGAVVTVHNRQGLVWKASTGELRCVGPAHERAVETSRASSNGLRIVTIDQGGEAKVWRSDDCAPIATIRTRGAVQDAAFSSDGDFLTVLARGGLTTWKILERPEVVLHRDAPEGLSWTAPLAVAAGPQTPPKVAVATKVGWSVLDGSVASYEIVPGKQARFVPLDSVQWSTSGSFGRRDKSVVILAREPFGDEVTFPLMGPWRLSSSGETLFAAGRDSHLCAVLTARCAPVRAIPAATEEPLYDESGDFVIDPDGRWAVDTRTATLASGPELDGITEVQVGNGFAVLRGLSPAVLWDLRDDRAMQLEAALAGSTLVAADRAVWRTSHGWVSWRGQEQRPLAVNGEALGFIDDRHLLLDDGDALAMLDLQSGSRVPLPELGSAALPLGRGLVVQEPQGHERMWLFPERRRLEALDALPGGIRSREIHKVNRFWAGAHEFLALELRWTNHGYVTLLRLQDDQLLHLLSIEGELVVVTGGRVYGRQRHVDALVFTDGVALLDGSAVAAQPHPRAALRAFLHLPHR